MTLVEMWNNVLSCRYSSNDALIATFFFIRDKCEAGMVQRDISNWIKSLDGQDLCKNALGSLLVCHKNIRQHLVKLILEKHVLMLCSTMHIQHVAASI